MARIEGIYQRFLKTIPSDKITTLSPKESEEINLKISEAFSKKAAEYRLKQRKAFLSLVQEYFFKLSNPSYNFREL